MTSVTLLSDNFIFQVNVRKVVLKSFANIEAMILLVHYTGSKKTVGGGGGDYFLPKVTDLALSVSRLLVDGFST